MIILIFLLLSSINFKVSKIYINGNEYFKDGVIKGLMLTKTQSIFRKGNFLPEIFKGDITAIQNFYNYNGFIESQIDYELAFDSIRNEVLIQININEGKQTFVEDVIFKGNILFKEDFLREKMTIKLGEPLNIRKMEMDNHIITSMYDDKGYADAKVKSLYTVRNYKAQIVYDIIEGKKQFIQEIEFIGLKYSQEDVIASETNLKSNDTFRYANILKSQRNLYNLGVFKSIRIQTHDASKPNFKIVQFILTEKEPIIIDFRLGYGTQDYLRVGAGFTHLNVLGRAWQGKIEGKASFAEYRLNTQITFPRLIIFPVRYRIGAFYQMKKEIGFKTRSIGGYTDVNFNLAGGKLLTKYDIKNVRTYFLDHDSIKNEWLHGLTINWLRDRRDDAFFTRRGYYLNINLETSGIIMPSGVNYVRPTFEYRLFKPILMSVAASSFKIGVVQEVTPSTDVPIYKKFYCGGTSSVRGYSEASIGPKDENENPLGGKILFELSQEIRFPIYKILGGAFFIDAGNIWQEYNEISARARWGVGAGLRLMTPLGNIRLDYGLKLRRQPEESIGALHFAIGEAF